MSHASTASPGAARPAAAPGQYLSFLIGGTEYAVGILSVREIIEHSTITRTPAAPASVRGVINLRGSVVPVVDLTVRFGQPPCAVTRRTCIVVVEVTLKGERLTIGVLADSVSQVVELTAADIEPPPAFGTPVHVDYLLGMGKVAQAFVLLLDVERVLAAGDLATAAAAASPGTKMSPGIEASLAQQAVATATEVRS